MKKTLLMLTIIASSIIVTAQEKTKQKEIGVSFNNLDNFGITYKFGNTQSMWRINTLLASGANRTEDFGSTGERTTSSIGLNLRFGREFRKLITDKLELRYGGDVSFNYNRSKSTIKDQIFVPDITTENTAYRPGVNFVFGFNYLLSKNFVVGAEILPGFNYLKTESDGFETTGFEYGLSNSSALLSLSYRF